MLRKVLTVDDSPLVLKMYRMVFRSYGCDIVTASNGLEALDRLSQESDIDLIMLDINMPLMDGLTFIRKRREIREFDKIPIIVVSTEGNEEDTVRALSLGAKGYVKKPFQPMELQELINKIVATGEGM